MRKSKKFILGGLAMLALAACSDSVTENSTGEPVDLVNPYMGNISHLLVPTYPTIHLPNSMMRIIPARGDFTAISIHGLPVFLTSHRDVSAFNLSPFQGDVDDLKPVLDYAYDREELTPYSYSVYLDEQQIQVDFGLSHQSAVYEIGFEQQGPAYLMLNSARGKVRWENNAIQAYQQLQNDTRVYLYMVPGESPLEVLTLADGELKKSSEADGQNACIVLKFPEGTHSLSVHYGISFISVEQARKNLEREVAGKNVAQLQSSGRELWNEALGKIKIKGGTVDQRKVFYTSLYRFYERPVCISEDGHYYSPFDQSVHEDLGRPFYIDDWIWDSYRAHHPLRILIDPEMEENILNSFVLMAEQSENFWLPTFPKITGDMHGMNSNHGVISILDAQRKGLGNFDLEKAYMASKLAITEKTLSPWSAKPAGALDQFYKDNGYFPALSVGQEETEPEVHSFERRQPVAVTLGTSYDQWCLSQIAGELGKNDEAEYFMEASFNYRNLFNPQTKFFHPKDAEGNFIVPFDYKFSGGMGARAYYDENNGWTYRWDVQHNIPDLITLMGGKESFVREMDAMFTEPLGRSKYAFYAQLPDQTGNVGQFSMANEPSFHIPYLYNYAGQPWKTQKRLRKLLEEWFRNDLMGVPGDEDGGGMSSFVVFSCMGFYPVTPGETTYSIGSPMFEHVSIDLGNGRSFEIEAHHASGENKYIESATLNGKKLNTPFICHEAIMSEGHLVFEMGPVANRLWGID